MNEPRQELLKNSLNDDDMIPLGPDIYASLTIPLGEKTGTARFEIISKQPKDQDIVHNKGEMPDGISGTTITESNSTQFHDNFIDFMRGQGYKMTAATDKADPRALFSEDVDISGKPLREVTMAFQRGLIAVKNITSTAIYNAVGPDAPESSQGNVRK
jgi:hypothetical protein